MSTVSRQDFIKNLPPSTADLLKPAVHNSATKPDALYPDKAPSKITITRIAFGMLGVIAAAAAAYYSYDRVNSLNIGLIKLPEPLLKPVVPELSSIPTLKLIDTSATLDETLNKPELKGEDPDTFVFDTTFVIEDQDSNFDEKYSEEKFISAYAEATKQHQPSESIEQEETVMPEASYIHEDKSSNIYEDESGNIHEGESGNSTSFYKEHEGSLLMLGVACIIGMVTHLYLNVFPGQKDSLEGILKNTSDTSGAEQNIKQDLEITIKKSNTANPEFNSPDSSQTKIMIFTPTKDGSFIEEDLHKAIQQVIESIFSLEKDGDVNFKSEEARNLIIDRIKDLADGALKLIKPENKALLNSALTKKQQENIVVQLAEAAKDLQLSLNVVSPKKQIVTETQNEEDSVKSKLAFTDSNPTELGVALLDRSGPMLQGTTLTARGGRGGARGGRGGTRGGSTLGRPKIVQTEEEIYYDNEKTKIDRNWKNRAKSFVEFSSFTSEAKAKIENLKVLVSVHEIYKDDGSELANDNYLKALGELTNFKNNSMAPISIPDASAKFKKFTEQELQILTVIYNREDKSGNVPQTEKEKPESVDQDRWDGFIVHQQEWGATLTSSGGFINAIQDRLKNRSLSKREKNYEMEPSEIIPPYEQKETKSKKQAISKAVNESKLTPLDELKMRFSARQSSSVKNIDLTGLNTPSSPYIPHVKKTKSKEIFNSAYEDNRELINEFENAAVKEIIVEFNDKLNKACESECDTISLLSLKKSCDLFNRYLQGSTDIEVLEFVEGYRDEINILVDKSLVNYAQTKLEMSADQAIDYVNDITASKKANFPKTIPAFKIKPKNLKEVFFASQSNMKNGEEGLELALNDANISADQPHSKTGVNGNHFPDLTDVESSESSIPQPLNDEEIELVSKFEDKALEGKIQEFRDDLVTAKKNSNTVLSNTLAGVIKSFNEYRYNRNNEDLVVLLVETYRDDLNRLVSQSLIDHALDSLSMLEINAQAYAKRMMESFKVTPKKTILEPEPTSLDDLLTNLTAPLSTTEEIPTENSEVQEISNSKSSGEEVEELYTGSDEEYMKSLLEGLTAEDALDDV
ncbi:MAG TPA: hypothetical protein VGP47_09065 [Parachlamydiaceae bacterium]|nr:hypothetical protein [Parachlamydiaceae bacterium]